MAYVLWILSLAGLGVFANVVTRGHPLGFILAGGLGLVLGPPLLEFFIGVFQ